MGRLFGTDGIRGLANIDLTAELALKTARAATQVLSKHLYKKVNVIIGKDTRASCDMLECALASGFSSAGAQVYLLGEIPTPAIAYLVGKYNADIGVMISASHNPAEYNGIKLFNSKGCKLDDDIEDEIEKLILSSEFDIREIPGRIHHVFSAVKDYTEYLIENIDAEYNPDLKVVVDCANGAASRTAKILLDTLKINAVILNNKPDGFNINENCGSVYINELSQHIKSHNADIGIAFDGDADRCLAIDKNGNVIDGDRIIAVLALDLKEKGLLRGNKVAVTTMSNMGFFKFMESKDVGIVDTKVGDRYVLEEMIKQDIVIGGEQSGHIILLDINSTGDGQLTALKLLAAISERNNNVECVSGIFKSFPQIVKNIKAGEREKAMLNEDHEFIKTVDKAKKKLEDNGRIIIRPSGTEPLIRIMVECEDKKQMVEIAEELATCFENSN